MCTLYYNKAVQVVCIEISPSYTEKNVDNFLKRDYIKGSIKSVLALKSGGAHHIIVSQYKLSKFSCDISQTIQDTPLILSLFVIKFES